METSTRCANCGLLLAAGAPDGLCPECVRAGVAIGTPWRIETNAASGASAPVEHIAAGATSETRDDAKRPSNVSNRSRWLILVTLWTLAGTFLWLQADLVNRYLNADDRFGAVGAAAPLQQIYPMFAADAQMWVRHSIALLEDGKLQLRHTSIDNAPQGREVHWNSAWAWCIAGAGKLHQHFTGLPLPRAVERATLWLNPAVMFALIILLSSWATRHLGAMAGVVIVVIMICDDRIYGGFFPSNVDHHGLLAVAVGGLVLGAVVMGAGWWQPAGGRFSGLPASPDIARRGAVFSALSGAGGMWVSAASIIPAIAIVGISGLLGVIFQGRAAAQHGATFDAKSWQLWGRIGAGASLAFYLIEYFPSHLGFRLEPNHPFHSLAWLGAGELIAQFGGRRLGPREQRWAKPQALLWPLLAIGVAPAAILIGGVKVFFVFDRFLATLHRDYIQEFLPVWRGIRSAGAWNIYQTIILGSLPVLAAIATLRYRRRDNVIVLWFVVFVTVALTVMAWWQRRWNLNAAGASIALILVVLAIWTARTRPLVRWAVVLVVLGLYTFPGAIFRYVVLAESVAAGRITRADAANVLSRDIAAALRESQPQGDIVLLTGPHSSVTIGYYGRIKTLGTFYWENGDGLKASAKILGADSEAEAATLIRIHGVTHIALVSDDNFINRYYWLLHPHAADEDEKRCFGNRLLLDKFAPSWLHVLPYKVPESLKGLNTSVMLFKVDLP